ncbi:hypothetical protein [Arthrobacter sp. A2-55]|uniref:hypothetical protein n=1 Tax=Arthrobacter sp. A2-55 TaxID=2897337 RepID=UPI0021CD6B23|nr:hypothetical protein [Arthrobacter sp. A2-55]MCU6481966.1 hypothetical protein [Arthrobacter sp. A2-55]
MTETPSVKNHRALRIARSLLDSEGCDPESLSIHEAVSDYAAENGLTEAASDKLAEQVCKLLATAVTTYEFDLRILG